MTKLTVDDSLRNYLTRLHDPAEVCDQSGRTLGRFLPEDVYRSWLYSLIEIPFSDEEVEHRRSESGGRSLPEVWTNLGRK